MFCLSEDAIAFSQENKVLKTSLFRWYVITPLVHKKKISYERKKKNKNDFTLLEKENDI